MIKIIFFDAAGTLFRLPRGVGWHYRSVAERHGWSLDEGELNRAFGAVWGEMPVRGPTRMTRPDDDKGWWRELVERVLDRCGVSAGKVDRLAYFEELYAEFTVPGVWELFPEVREVLIALHPRFRLGVISNFDGRLRSIIGHFGLADLFETLVISSEVGADKPDAWIFQHALALAGVAPGEALHVGDDPICDWRGATAAGLHSFSLQRPANSLRDLLTHLTVLSAS
jgi:putative hydrolase of the HAD superfamily